MLKKLQGTTVLAAILVLLNSAVIAQTFSGVLTQHNDLSRTGQNLNETVLTPQNVKASAFGKVFQFAVDGQIYAQPLYVPGVSIPQKGVHNVVYVVTENDSAYAFDADGKSTTPLWQRSFINQTNGITPVPCGTDGSTTDISCNVFPYYGITGTPVIDPVSQTMYFVVRTAETSNGTTNYFQRLHAIDITTGAEKFGGPVAVSGSVPGTGAGSVGGMVPFDPLADIQRPGLTLVNGIVYIGWAGAAHGWIMGYNAHTLAQTAIFNTAPNAVLAGVWQTGNGFVADSAGTLYIPVGDGLFDADGGGPDYGDALLKLDASLNVIDYFTPMDQACRQETDGDLGSAGPVLLPTQGGQFPNELLLSGKGGDPCDPLGSSPIYLINRDQLGKYDPNQDHIIQEVTSGGSNGGYWSSPAFWQATGSPSYVYLAGTGGGGDGNNGDPLKAYTLSAPGSAGLLSSGPVSQSSNFFSNGATPSVSANGTTNGIVWAIERSDGLDQQPGATAAILHAYNATNVAVELYNSSLMTNGRDQPGCANKFQTPTIANGRVYVGTQTQLDVYGLLGTSNGPLVSLSSPCNTFPPTESGQRSAPWVVAIKNIGTATLTFAGIKITGTNSADFKLTNKCGASLAPKTSCNLAVTFAPTGELPETAFVTIKDNAVGSPHNIGLVGSIAVPTVLLNPTFLSFGKQDINITSAPQSVTLANSSNLPVTINSIAITGDAAADFAQTNNCPASLAVNANCQINVTFTPLVTGNLGANLTITDNASGSPQQVSLTGAGVQPNVVLNPNSLPFGSHKVGVPTQMSSTLTNNGGGTLFINSIQITGADPQDFSQTNNCGSSVPSAGSCTITVTFKPTVVGSRSANVTITDNSDPSPQTITLTGTGT